MGQEVTPVILPIITEEGSAPSGAFPWYAAVGIGAFLVLIGVMMCAMVWDSAEYMGSDTFSEKLIWWCMMILSASILVSGLVFWVAAVLG